MSTQRSAAGDSRVCRRALIEKTDGERNVECLFQLECRHIMDLVANPERRPVLCLLGQNYHLRGEVDRHNPAGAESS
jgi:hypothetical protein